MRRPNQNQGVIALMIILVLCGLSIILVLGVGILAQTGLGLATTNNNAEQNFNLAQACAETALIKLKENINYAGNEIITIQDDVCQIRPIINLGGQSRTIETQATYGNQTHKLRIQISNINPQITIQSWQGIADF
ncbi:MAG: hypothetical protein COS76_00220 [Candidatus Portnoybacteria bacterium CG06_land_8_20_14_3_00_39_12]|uniref:Type 4 fimbrial biogenesis protein PilX N-terminal domain-containing protein n=3 Tax=Candidatus Portnoyibacteriota TaxID=1817913 RepID=A0A2M8KH31_9BACT|nr:MAG: hypothetical protein AUJ33_01005 [Parcubacteria group bacterium CG1_02_40_25]PIU75546.1 MAG: hypothetical protein COS76_00220 [Candidatus Portnoybacteria bacterium CG06_land_8_20_14_3_00_39_12]PIZ70826.1 MAG: hypothetical protein COY09_02005 [Candidatus Portnoybacteria bacterium CG_4_10_14_0_2_um_filter_39_11]PJE59234.1 MAG: hypothetical protein COU83_00085 [Candidatus Portnoybacteria bacterium CG10_big_fil_rev_8_21_14_0_10_40_22]